MQQLYVAKNPSTLERGYKALPFITGPDGKNRRLTSYDEVANTCCFEDRKLIRYQHDIPRGPEPVLVYETIYAEVAKKIEARVSGGRTFELKMPEEYVCVWRNYYGKIDEDSGWIMPLSEFKEMYELLNQ